MEAGFDGVQILANYLYLISQFLNATTPTAAATRAAEAWKIVRGFSSR